MKADMERTYKVTLELNYQEADWLKNVMQNPVTGVCPSEEDDTDKENRGRLWNVLSKALEKR